MRSRFFKDKRKHKKVRIAQKNPSGETVKKVLAEPIKQDYMHDKIFRPQTKHGVQRINFFLSQGGLGDYICHMPAFEYLAEMQKAVAGRIFVERPFYDVAKYIMRKYETWEVHNWDKPPTDIMKAGEPILDPANYNKYINACGSHLLDLGFIYYANQSPPPPQFNRMPSLMGVEANFSKWPELLKNFDNYAVITPCATTDARTIPEQHFNTLVNYTLEKGVIPVFLGKRDFASLGKKSDYYAKTKEGYDLSNGIDLREQTELLETIAIMKHAKFVMGLDNGLLHFAGCTETPVIFGHSITDIHHRNIRRPKGETINIALSKEVLPCAGCQSNMRFIYGHKFKRCVYNDYKCLDMLFVNKAQEWRRAIDHILDR